LGRLGHGTGRSASCHLILITAQRKPIQQSGAHPTTPSHRWSNPPLPKSRAHYDPETVSHSHIVNFCRPLNYRIRLYGSGRRPWLVQAAKRTRARQQSQSGRRPSTANLDVPGLIADARLKMVKVIRRGRRAGCVFGLLYLLLALQWLFFAKRLCNGCGSDVTYPLIYLFQAKKIATNLFQGFV
jgi:hypothetical protein